MRKIFFLTLLVLPMVLFGQTEFGSYNWNTYPSDNKSDTIKCVNGAAVTLERRITEVFLNKQNIFEEIFVFHKKIKVDSHDALDHYNKIYIPLNNVLEILNIQARFISPSGKITNLPKESIKQIANLENDGDYKTFAIEGAEVGGQIEYFYTLRKEFDAYSGYYIQDDIPKANVEIIFAYPSKLAYQIKGYNGFPAFTQNTSNEEKTYQKASVKYIPAVEEKVKYANYKASLMRFEYTMAFNHYRSALRLNSWKTASENTYNRLFELSAKDNAAIQSLLAQINPPTRDLTQQIRTIENWVKKNIAISKEINAQKELSEMIRLKQANHYGAVRIMVALLNAANINFEFVETGNNETRPFDPDFNCMNFLDDYLVYFPAINQYMAPGFPDYRLGLIPTDYQGQYGLFLRPISYSDKLKSLAYDIRRIPIHDCTLNTDTIDVVVNVNPAESVVSAQVKRQTKGALGQTFQSFFNYLNEEKKKELVSSFFSMGKENSVINNYQVNNESPDNIGVNPITWAVDLTANSLLENAGKDLIFHIGETIGQQSELYQEKSRTIPIHVGALHKYYRKIVFNIPQGYKVANPENLNMHVEMKNEGKTSCIFTSQAEIKKDQLVITSDEYYLEESYPASRYDEFRSVINASADFNKRTILLKKI